MRFTRAAQRSAIMTITAIVGGLAFGLCGVCLNEGRLLLALLNALLVVANAATFWAVRLTP